MKRAVKYIGTFVVVVFAVVLGLFEVQYVNAKTKKPYKAKTVRVVATMENRIHQTKSPVKKVKKISKNKNFKIRLIPNENKYIFVASGVDIGKKQAVKVYYENGRTQVITFKAETNYLDKIKKELKPLLANPDAGLKKSLEQWEQRDMAGKSYTYQFVYERSTDFEGENPVKYEKYKEEDIYKKLTASQKKALILEIYVHSRSHYRMDQRWIYSNCDSSVKFNRQFKKLYYGTFAGVCADGAKIAYDIGRQVGLKTKYVSCGTINHAWCVVKATDEKGKPYWHGIYTTAHGYSLNSSISRYHTDKYSKKQIVKNLHEPCYVHIANKRISRRDVLLEQAEEKRKRARAQSTTTTITNCKCPGCYATSERAYKHTRPSNPYITNYIYCKKDGTHVYEHNGNGYKQWFDAEGNEYFDANGDGSIMDDL